MTTIVKCRLTKPVPVCSPAIHPLTSKTAEIPWSVSNQQSIYVSRSIFLFPQNLCINLPDTKWNKPRLWPKIICYALIRASVIKNSLITFVQIEKKNWFTHYSVLKTNRSFNFLHVLSWSSFLFPYTDSSVLFSKCVGDERWYLIQRCVNQKNQLLNC